MADIEIETNMPSTAFEGIMLGAQAAGRAASASESAAGASEDAAGLHAIAAAISAETALAAAGNFDTIADGLAATAEGSTFVVRGTDTDTFATLYRKIGGAAVAIATYASAAAFAAAAGASLIGFRQPGSSAAIVRTVGDKWTEYKTTLDYGAIGDGVQDDTPWLQDQVYACADAGASVVLSRPPVMWRTTATIESAGPNWRGLNGRLMPWLFDPPAGSPDMTAALHITNTYGKISGIALRGTDGWAPRGTNFIADVSQGPQSDDGGWYEGFFKPGTCGIKVDDFSQVHFEDVWTSFAGAGSFKAGLFLDTIAGHCIIGRGCRHFDLIGVRYGRNSDDLMFQDEPIIANGFAGIVFGTSNLNGTFNGGMGLRGSKFYAGSCSYGILQMADHGAKGTALPNPALPPMGIYGALQDQFFEFIGECGVQLLPGATTSGLDFADMGRFSWEDGNRLPDVMANADSRQRYAFRLGRVFDNVQLGTTRAEPTYASPFVTGGQSIHATGIYGDASTVIAQPLLASTVVDDLANSSAFKDPDGRTLREGHLMSRQDFATCGNLLLDPLQPANWLGASVATSDGAGVVGSQPRQMKAELGNNPVTVKLAGPGFRALPFVAAPDASVVDVPLFLSMWAYFTGSVLFRVQTTDGPGHELYSATLYPAGWQRVVLGNAFYPSAAATRLEINVNDGDLWIASAMGSTDILRPFTRSSAPSSSRLVQLGGGVEIDTDLRLNGLTGPAPANTDAAGYITVMIDGAPAKIAYSR